MSNKDRFPKNESKENNRVDDINLVSRLLEKMLEEQNKKVKEINVNMPLNNNSRFSQTIQPKSENKLNSVLKTVKNQVVNEDKNRLSAYSKIRSPTQKDLHINNTGNIPILMERESYLRDSRGSPNQSMKSSENSKIVVVDDAYRGSGSNQFNFIDSKPNYQSNDKYRIQSVNSNSPQRNYKTHNIFKSIENLLPNRNERPISDFKSPVQTQVIPTQSNNDSNINTEENLQYLISNYQNKIADIVLKNFKNQQLKVTEKIQDEPEAEPEFSVPNKRGGRIDLSNFSSFPVRNSANLPQKPKPQENSEEIVMMENSDDVFSDRKNDELILIDTDSLWKRLKNKYYRIEIQEILQILYEFINLKRQIRQPVTYDMKIPVFRKISKNERLIKKLIRIQMNIRCFLRKMRSLRDEKSNRILRKSYMDFFINFKKILLRVLEPNPLKVLKDYTKKIMFRDIMNKIIIGKTNRFYFRKLLRLNKIYKILKNQLSLCEMEQWTKYFYLWERRVLLSKYTNSANKIKSRWQIHRTKRKVMIIRALKKLFITQRNLSMFHKLFLLGKLSKTNRIPEFIRSLLLMLSKYSKKNVGTIKSILSEWNTRAHRIKYKEAIRLIISLMRHNLSLKGKEIYHNKILMKNYIHGYVQKIKNNCINEMVKDNDSKLIARKKFYITTPAYLTKIIINSVTSLETLISKLQEISKSFNDFHLDIFLYKLKDKYRFIKFGTKIKEYLRKSSLRDSFVRWKNIHTNDKKKILDFESLVRNSILRNIFRIITRNNRLFRLIHLLNLNNQKHIGRFLFRWYNMVSRERYNEKASKIVKNWRLHRVRKMVKSLKFYRLVFRIMYLRSFIYNSNKQRFIKKFQLLLSKLHTKLMNNFRERLWDWRDDAISKKKVVLKSRRPDRRIDTKRTILPSLISKANQVSLPDAFATIIQNFVKTNLEIMKNKLNYIQRMFANKVSGMKKMVRIRFNFDRQNTYNLFNTSFKTFKRNTLSEFKYVPKDQLKPINIIMPHSLVYVKTYVLRPITPVSIINEYLKTVVEKKNEKINKIKRWYNLFLKRNGFKTLSVVIPRSSSVKIMKVLTDKRILLHYFNCYKRIVETFTRLDFIKKLSSIRRIQKKFRNFRNKIKFYHKLYTIVNGVHTHLTEKLHKRFILWIKHLNYTKLSKAIKLIIDLMRENTHILTIERIRRKFYEMADKKSSLFISNFVMDLKILSGMDHEKQKIHSFINRINFKECYRFITLAKDCALKSNKFFGIFERLYNNYSKNSLIKRLRLWNNSTYKNKILLNDTINSKQFISCINNKESRLFLMNLRILTGREMKLKEYLLKYLRRIMFGSSLSKWYDQAITFKKYKSFSQELDKVVKLHELREKVQKIFKVSYFNKILNNMNNSINDSVTRSCDYHAQDFLKKLREVNYYLSFESTYSNKNDQHKNSRIRHSNFEMNSFSYQIKDTAAIAGKDIQNFRIMSEYLNSKSREIHKSNMYYFFSNLKQQSKLILLRREKLSRVQQLQILTRKLNLADYLKSLRTVRDRIKNIDLLITTKAKILNNTKKSVFALLFKRGLRLNKPARLFYDYLNQGIGDDYMPSIGENFRLTQNPYVRNSMNTQREMLLKSLQKIKNNISYYSPGENLYVRNIYSYKWWEGQVIKSQVDDNSQSYSNRNIYKYLEGFSLRNYWNDSHIKSQESTVDIAPLPKMPNQMYLNTILQIPGKEKPYNYINNSVDINIYGAPKQDTLIYKTRFMNEDTCVQYENNIFIYQVSRLLHNILYSRIETNNNIELLRPRQEFLREFQFMFTIKPHIKPIPKYVFDYVSNLQILQCINREYYITYCNNLDIYRIEKTPNYVENLNSIYIQREEPEEILISNVSGFTIRPEPEQLSTTAYYIYIERELRQLNYISYVNGFQIKAKERDPLYSTSHSVYIQGEEPVPNYISYVNGFHIDAKERDPLYSTSHSVYIQGEEPVPNYISYVNGFHIDAKERDPLYSTSHSVYIQGEEPVPNYISYVNGFHIDAKEKEPLYSTSHSVYIQGEEPVPNYISYVNGFHIDAKEKEPLYSTSHSVYIHGEEPVPNYVENVNSVLVKGKEREINILKKADSLHIYACSPRNKSDNHIEKVNNFLIYGEDKEENMLEYQNDFQIYGLDRSRFRNLTKNILEVVEIKAPKKININYVESVNGYSILHFPPPVTPLSKHKENNIQIIQTVKPKPMAVQRVNPIQIIREKKKDFAKQKTSELNIKAKPKPGLSVSQPTRMSIAPKPKDNSKIIAKNYFTINSDESIRLRLIKESERKIKESYRINWVDTQKVRLQETLLIKPKPKIGLVIENSILELFESRKPLISLPNIVIEEGAEDAGSDHLRESVVSNDPLKLRISIKKKETPKNAPKVDVINKLGAKRSKTILNDIFNNLESKKEDFKLGESLGSRKEERPLDLMTLESKKESNVVFRDNNLQEKILYESNKDSPKKVDFQELSNKQDANFNMNKVKSKDSGTKIEFNRLNTVQSIKRPDIISQETEDEKSLKNSKRDITKLNVNDLIKKTEIKENQKELEIAKNKVNVVNYANPVLPTKKTVDFKGTTSNSKLDVLKPNNKKLLTGLVKRKTTKTEELILREETETDDFKTVNIKTPK